MNLTKNIMAATLAVTTILGIAPAAPAQARTSMSISYRDVGYRDYRHDNRHRRWDRDRYDRYDNRRWGWNNGYRYRTAQRCWTEWRYDRRRHDRVRVRMCR